MLGEAQSSTQSRSREWKALSYAIDSISPAPWLPCRVGLVDPERSIEQEGEARKRWEQIRGGFARYTKNTGVTGNYGKSLKDFGSKVTY